MNDLLTDLQPAYSFAPLGKRWLAAFIDYFIYWFMFFVIVYAFGNVERDSDGSVTHSLNGTPSYFAMILPWLLLFPGVETFNNGQTIGKAVCKVRVVDANGDPVNFGIAFVRHLFDLIDYFPFFGIAGLVVASNNSNKQRVGDLVAKTMVIDAIKG